jgi:hypothetical protein
LFGLWLFASVLSAAAPDDDDDKAPAGQKGALPSLSTQQQRAVGIVVARAFKASTPERIPALGLVLDPATLVADSGEIDSARAAERAAAAEGERLRGLLHAGAGASQKALEAAQAETAHTHAQADAANARFASRWGALATLPALERQKTIAAVASGRHLLLRAELPGRHSLGIVPTKAILDVDGVDLPARVLGLVAQAATDAQGVGVLIEVDDPLPGLGAGARVPVALVGAVRSGLLVPRGALLYDDSGAYVYKQLSKKTADGKNQYAQVKIKLLLAQGDGWLVEGIDDDDDIVVHGAGVLWSLQGLGGQKADDDD